MADVKIGENGHMVCFLSLPESQFIRLSSIAHDNGVSLDQYVSACLVSFESLTDYERMRRLSEYGADLSQARG